MIDKKTRNDLRDTFVRLANIILTSELILMSHNGDERNTDRVNKAIAARIAVAEEIIKKWREDERLK